MAEVHPYYYSGQKRLFDFALSIVLLWFLWPVLVLIGGLVWLTVGWPVIFRQKRMGLKKQVFTMYKFRTMYVGAEKKQLSLRRNNEAPEPMFKLANDPRFVGLGKFLSRTGMDELPQLLNIFLGEMSFVGPRPLPVNEASKLDASWDFRYQVRPGVFSEWTLSLARFKSADSWKKLEKKTLAYGDVVTDVKYILRTLLIHLNNLLES